MLVVPVANIGAAERKGREGGREGGLTELTLAIRNDNNYHPRLLGQRQKRRRRSCLRRNEKARCQARRLPTPITERGIPDHTEVSHKHAYQNREVIPTIKNTRPALLEPTDGDAVKIITTSFSCHLPEAPITITITTITIIFVIIIPILITVIIIITITITISSIIAMAAAKADYDPNCSDGDRCNCQGHWISKHVGNTNK